ncbi:hypothetical protein ABZ860_34805 [Microbispora sp. NPDC046973]
MPEANDNPSVEPEITDEEAPEVVAHSEEESEDNPDCYGIHIENN